MTDFFLHLGEYLTGVSVVGLIVWVWALWRSHMTFRVHVAETYARRTEIDDVKDAISTLDAKVDQKMGELAKTVQDVLGLCHELKGRVQAGKS